jgi:hypothetical protein
MAKTNYNYEKRARELEKQKKKEEKRKKKEALKNSETKDETVDAIKEEIEIPSDTPNNQEL